MNMLFTVNGYVNLVNVKALSSMINETDSCWGVSCSLFEFLFYFFDILNIKLLHRKPLQISVTWGFDLSYKSVDFCSKKPSCIKVLPFIIFLGWVVFSSLLLPLTTSTKKLFSSRHPYSFLLYWCHICVYFCSNSTIPSIHYVSISTYQEQGFLRVPWRVTCSYCSRREILYDKKTLNNNIII